MGCGRFLLVFEYEKRATSEGSTACSIGSAQRGLCRVIPHYTRLYSIIVYYAILDDTILYPIISYYTILYYTILYNVRVCPMEPEARIRNVCKSRGRLRASKA